MPITPAFGNFKNRVPGIVYGADYNPEQWPRETWEEDIRLMRQANVRMVNLGVFSWSALEASDGEFTFDWLDEIMDLLWDSRIFVDLGTPNASPPPWLVEDFPETRMVERGGVRVGTGSRGHFCPSSPVYRDRSLRIAGKLAERYGQHPALAMWHIGNEYHAHCHCDLCDAGFREWLKARYGDLEHLNQAWGTTVWSQVYSDWSQVHLPRPVRGGLQPPRRLNFSRFTGMNPARELDFARFNTAVQVELYRSERDLLRKYTPQIPATTNFVQFLGVQDYQQWAPELDLIAFDSYPDPIHPGSLLDAALQYDYMRSLGGGAPWALTEQATGAVSQWPVNVAKAPGAMRLGSYQAVARGADAVMFFQWRAARFGQEKFHSSMLPHGGTDTRTWQEVEALGNELDKITAVAGATTPARVGFVWDTENRWAVEGIAHPRNDFNYYEVSAAHYAAVWRTKVASDVVTLSHDLSGYDALVIPNQYLITQDQSTALHRYVEGGGHVLISYFSGIVDENDKVWENGYPGGLRSTIGAHVREMYPHVGDAFELRPEAGGDEWGTSVPVASTWQDDICLEGASALAVYAEGDLAGKPAVIEHRLGKGRVVYLGTSLEQDHLDGLMASFIRQARVEPVMVVPDSVEVTERLTEDQRFLFLLNHAATSVEVHIEETGTDLLTGSSVDAGEVLTLQGRGVAVIQAERSA